MSTVIRIVTAIYLIAGVAMVLLGIVAVQYGHPLAWINFSGGGFVIIDAVMIFYRLTVGCLAKKP